MLSESDHTNSADERPSEAMDSLGDLATLIGACNDVDEFRRLLQQRGIWLNRNAAESAFATLQVAEDGELDDEALGAVSGGVNMIGGSQALIKALIQCF